MKQNQIVQMPNAPKHLDEALFHASFDYEGTSTRTKPNRIMKEFIAPFLKARDVETALDFGCGQYLRDAKLLAKKGIHVYAVDLPKQFERITDRLRTDGSAEWHYYLTVSTRIHPNLQYGAALLNFVINYIPEAKARSQMIGTVLDAVKPNGYFVISVRSAADIARDIAPEHTEYKDGFLVPKSSGIVFVRGYTREELEKIVKSNHLRMVNLSSNFASITALCRKE